MPGLLSAIAGLATVTGTLLGALYAAGVIGGAQPEASKAAVVSATAKSSSSSSSQGNRGQSSQGRVGTTGSRGQTGAGNASGTSGTGSGQSDGSSAGQSSLTEYVGAWINDDPNTRGITRIEITQDGQGLDVHPHGSCVPDECDWGTRPANVAQEPFTVPFDFSGGLTHDLTFELQASGTSLQVTDVGSASGTNTYTFHK